MPAAAPAFETARLLSLVVIGVDTLRGLGLLIATAGLSVFIVRSRRAYVCRLLPLTCWAPDVAEPTLDGRQTKGPSA